MVLVPGSSSNFNSCWDNRWDLILSIQMEPKFQVNIIGLCNENACQVSARNDLRGCSRAADRLLAAVAQGNRYNTVWQRNRFFHVQDVYVGRTGWTKITAWNWLDHHVMRSVILVVAFWRDLDEVINLGDVCGGNENRTETCVIIGNKMQKKKRKKERKKKASSLAFPADYCNCSLLGHCPKPLCCPKFELLLFFFFFLKDHVMYITLHVQNCRQANQCVFTTPS